jgi:hypothetical protein
LFLYRDDRGENKSHNVTRSQVTGKAGNFNNKYRELREWVDKTMENMQKGQVVLYKNKVEVRLDKETVWLTAHQIAKFFGIDRTGVVRHIQNIYQTKELPKNSTCAKNAQVAVASEYIALDI